MLENNYYIISIMLLIMFSLGVFAGVLTVKFFSKNIMEKLENIFLEQFKLSKIFFENSSDILVAKLEEQVDFSSSIYKNFQDIHKILEIIYARLDILNESCDTKEKLEKEIIKLKKILKRVEKRNANL